MYRVKVEYKIGDHVVLITDDQKLQRIVIGISVRENGNSYELANGTTTSWHYPVELAKYEATTAPIGFQTK